MGDIMNTKHLIIGIDPGLSGAIAFYNYESKTLVSVVDMPVVKDAKTDKTRLDEKGIVKLIKRHEYYTRFAVLEKVHAMPKDGPVQAHRFGDATGFVRGVLNGRFIHVVQTLPSVWKPLMNLSHDKADSLKKAREMFPSQATNYFSLKKHDGRAEAALLAVFGERFVQ